METGKDKVRKICDVLRKETLEPSQKQAEEMLAQASLQAQEIIAQAYLKQKQLLVDAKEQIQREKAIFESSLSQTSKQVIEALKQEIEENIFHKELLHLLKGEMNKPEVLSRLINAVIAAIEKEGIESDLSVYIPEAVPAREVNALLLQNILGKLQEKSVLIGSSIHGGMELKIHDKNISIEITDSSLEELIERYSRRDFHEIIFKK
ncbi:MAG TPA: V-type ATP synthase subunit E [Candidatus Rhabdochlamydia sp.]|jgi:V/A-type H+/Na+-transporting ATPase subunit E|nr:V-type ATP synthase subunit E [Candidatus Rhabdochlamydia sp.]